MKKLDDHEIQEVFESWFANSYRYPKAKTSAGEYEYDPTDDAFNGWKAAFEWFKEKLEENQMAGATLIAAQEDGQ